MKKVITLAFFAFFALSVSTVSAQSFKFGHINFQELIQAMPELDSAQKKLQAYEKDLQEILQDVQTELQRKQKDYEEKQATWSDAVRNAKQRDITDGMRRLQEQAGSFEQDYAKEQQRLFEPIATKAREALNKVGKANGFTYIFDLSANSILYFNDAQSVDVLPLVKKEMNIK